MRVLGGRDPPKFEKDSTLPTMVGWGVPHSQVAKWPRQLLLTEQSSPAGSLGRADWLTKGGTSWGWNWRLGDHGSPLTIIFPTPTQFRGSLQDLLPTMPKADDYFLLRWLRGKAGRGGGFSREGVGDLGRQCHRVVKNASSGISPFCVRI